ncbi:hypothetical protein VNO77_39343 [Canavalia gladiata]|uniref:Uncharacterized protein n=1 Tax=Canavalia gladiata TaxID=3824 RepID=A0AAN9KCG5_CANGL
MRTLRASAVFMVGMRMESRIEIQLDHHHNTSEADATGGNGERELEAEKQIAFEKLEGYSKQNLSNPIGKGTEVEVKFYSCKSWHCGASMGRIKLNSVRLVQKKAQKRRCMERQEQSEVGTVMQFENWL